MSDTTINDAKGERGGSRPEEVVELGHACEFTRDHVKCEINTSQQQRKAPDDEARQRWPSNKGTEHRNLIKYLFSIIIANATLNNTFKQP